MCLKANTRVTNSPTLNTNKRFRAKSILNTDYTVCCISLGRCCFGLEIIKISTHPFYSRNFDWFSWGWSKQTKIFENKIHSTYMVVRLSDVRSKTGKKCLFSHQFILLTQWPIPEIFAKKYWEVAVLKNSVLLSQQFWIKKKKKKMLHPHENQSKFLG